MLAAFPLAAALVATVFAVQLARQWVDRRRPHALAWALSLACYAVASLAVAVGVSGAWSRGVFAAYWIGGALLNVPLLAVGQLLLLDRRRTALWWTLGGLAVVWSVVLTAMAGFDAEVLAAASRTRTIPLGREVLAGSTAYALARPFSYTFLVVVVGSIWSAVRSKRWAVLLIALGVTVVATSSSAVRVGQGQVFSVLLAVGVTVMYAGFRAASAPSRRAAPAPAAQPAG